MAPIRHGPSPNAPPPAARRPYPGKDHVVTAGLYFLKAAKLNVGPGHWGDALFLLALLGTAVALWRFRQYRTWLLLWVPLAFYALSIAYGSVPIFIPTWWPFSYYNVRYGLELLPVFAVFPALLAVFLADLVANPKKKAGRLEFAGAAGGGQLSVDLRRRSHHSERSASQRSHAHGPGR